MKVETEMNDGDVDVKDLAAVRMGKDPDDPGGSYLCQHCGSGFDSMLGLGDHLKLKNPDGLPRCVAPDVDNYQRYRCDVCSKGFSTKDPFCLSYIPYSL